MFALLRSKFDGWGHPIDGQLLAPSWILRYGFRSGDLSSGLKEDGLLWDLLLQKAGRLAAKTIESCELT